MRTYPLKLKSRNREKTSELKPWPGGAAGEVASCDGGPSLRLWNLSLQVREPWPGIDIEVVFEVHEQFSNREFLGLLQFHGFWEQAEIQADLFKHARRAQESNRKLTPLKSSSVDFAVSFRRAYRSASQLPAQLCDVGMGSVVKWRPQTYA